MTMVTFIEADGEAVVVENAEGTVMECAVENDVEGIDGNCGGVCSCATCHVHVAAEWLEKVGKASEDERELLEFEDNVNERSRLSCQIEITDAVDGLIVEVPE
ncbi:MAG: 2Fe-2S ferredoxin [Cryomorphaceae bacterium]|jgi:2Fe-2S ferredoxin